MALRVVNPLEPRLHDVVAIPEVNKVASEFIPLACTEQRQGLSVGEGAFLEYVQLIDILGVDGRDEMDPLGLVEGLWPVFRRAPPDVPELHGAGGHAFNEFVREHFKRSAGRAEGAQSLIGQANVETGIRLLFPPVPDCDLRDTVA